MAMITESRSRSISLGRYWTSIESGIVSIFDLLMDWQERASMRGNLKSLDHRMLKDIGLSSSDVNRETEKPFWRT